LKQGSTTIELGRTGLPIAHIYATLSDMNEFNSIVLELDTGSLNDDLSTLEVLRNELNVYWS
jgi:hypothetical protein